MSSGELGAAPPPPPPPPPGDGGAGLLPVAALAAGLPLIVGAAADVAGYFQSNYTLSGKAIDATIDPVLAALAGAVRRPKGEAAIVTVVDTFQALSTTTKLGMDWSTVSTSRWAAVAKRFQLEARVAQLKADATAKTTALTYAKAELAKSKKANRRTRQPWEPPLTMSRTRNPRSTRPMRSWRWPKA